MLFRGLSAKAGVGVKFVQEQGRDIFQVRETFRLAGELDPFGLRRPHLDRPDLIEGFERLPDPRQRRRGAHLPSGGE